MTNEGHVVGHDMHDIDEYLYDEPDNMFVTCIGLQQPIGPHAQCRNETVAFKKVDVKQGAKDYYENAKAVLARA